jgi:hypothetical protein
MIGLIDRERVDAALYDDFETEKAREVCCVQFYFTAFIVVIRYTSMDRTVWFGCVDC